MYWRQTVFGWPEDIAFYPPIVLGFAGVGLIIALRQTHNTVGWLLLSTALVFGLLPLTNEYATVGLFGPNHPFAMPGAHIIAGVWEVLSAPIFGLISLTLLVFPHGRLPGPHWRLPALLVVGLTGAVAFGLAAQTQPVTLDWRNNFVVANPFALRSPAWAVAASATLGQAWFVVAPTMLGLAACSIVLRFAGAQGILRQQLKWVVCAVGVATAGAALFVPAALLSADWLWDVAFGIAVFGVVALPVAIAVAMLRYRLYAIDLILNRAALYGGLTLVLGAAFVAATALSQQVFEGATGHHSDLMPAASGVLVAIAFEPVRRCARVMVDRILPAREERALVFGDIVGSTQRLAEVGDQAWRDLLARYRETVRRELRRFGGAEVHAAGDGFFATFADPLQAARFTLALAPGLQELGVATRFGMHWGACEVRGEDVTGLAVWIAARVMSTAGASEVVVSDAMREVLESAGNGPSLEDRGAYNLKGLPGEWRIHAISPRSGG